MVERKVRLLVELKVEESAKNGIFGPSPLELKDQLNHCLQQNIYLGHLNPEVTILEADDND